MPSLRLSSTAEYIERPTSPTRHLLHPPHHNIQILPLAPWQEQPSSLQILVQQPSTNQQQLSAVVQRPEAFQPRCHCLEPQRVRFAPLAQAPHQSLLPVEATATAVTFAFEERAVAVATEQHVLLPVRPPSLLVVWP